MAESSTRKPSIPCQRRNSPLPTIAWKKPPMDLLTLVLKVLVRKTFTKSPVQAWTLIRIRVATAESRRGLQFRTSGKPKSVTMGGIC